MKERKKKLEQYFFDSETVGHLAAVAACYANPCCLCTPTIGAALVERRVASTILEADERWASLNGFRKFDLRNPRRLPIEGRFGIIVTDPPFFAVTINEVYKTIRYLADGDDSQPILLTHLDRFLPEILRRFERYGLEPIDYYPGYRTEQNNSIRLYGNIDTCSIEHLVSVCRRRLTTTPQKRDRPDWRKRG